MSTHDDGTVTRTCTKCKKSLPSTDEYFYKSLKGSSGLKSWCIDCFKQYAEDNHDKISRRMMEYRKSNHQRIAESSAAKRSELKRLVIGHYGGKCACCGEEQIEFLTIDHMNNDGSKHRKSLGIRKGGGVKFYRWLRNNKFPPGFQVLCFNCNATKYLFGVCPHQRIPVHRDNNCVALPDTKFHDDLMYPPTTKHNFFITIGVDVWEKIQEGVLELVKSGIDVDDTTIRYWTDVLDGKVPQHIRLTRPDLITNIR